MSSSFRYLPAGSSRFSHFSIKTPTVRFFQKHNFIHLHLPDGKSSPGPQASLVVVRILEWHFEF
jgi:hypothetical protein